MKTNLSKINDELLEQEIKRRERKKAQERTLEKKKKHIEFLKEIENKLINEPNKINKKLFYEEYGSLKNVAQLYLNQNDVIKCAKKRKLNDFLSFFDKNRDKTINILLFESGFINSDHFISNLAIKNIVDGTKYMKKSAANEVIKILTKNNEFDLLNGSLQPISRLPYTEGACLPFQYPISMYAQSFKFNYTIDCSKNIQTKKELKKLRDERINDLFFNLDAKNKMGWIYIFLDIYNQHEIILRKNNVLGNDLLEKVGEFDFMQENFNKDLEKLKEDIYMVQVEQQQKILNFMSKNPKQYLELIENLISLKRKEDEERKRPHYSDDGYSGIGFSGSNGGPIGKLEKITSK